MFGVLNDIHWTLETVRKLSLAPKSRSAHVGKLVYVTTVISHHFDHALLPREEDVVELLWIHGPIRLLCGSNEKLNPF